MDYSQLTPLPFLPVFGKFDLNTYVQGSSDYEIMARVVETYNAAVKLFNQIIKDYGDFDNTIKQLTKNYEDQLKQYKQATDKDISDFKTSITNQQTTFETNINTKINELTTRVNECYEEVEKLINGEYIETYVQALAAWIDNNLQVMVSKLVKYVWFEVNEDGYFVAYIPDTWDFIDFDTEMNPDNEDYGKLALLWETAIVQ